MRLKTISFFTVFLLGFVTEVLCAPVLIEVLSVDQYKHSTRIEMDQVGMLVDSSGSMTVKEVLRSKQFVPFHLEGEFQPGVSYWFSIRLKNSTSQDLEYILFSNEWNNAFWEVTQGELLYRGLKGALLSKVHDDFYSGQNNECKLAFDLPAGEEKTLIVKIDGDIGQLPFKINNCFYLEQRQAFEVRADKDLLAVGVFTGIVIVLILINTVLGFAYQEHSSFFYLGFVLLMSGFQTGYYKLIWWVFPGFSFDFSLIFPLIWFFYIWFVATYLDFRRTHRSAWFVAKILGLFTFLSSIGLVILYNQSVTLYYTVLPRLNTFFAVASILYMYYTATAPGKLKYFVLIGLFFGVSGAILTTLSLHFHFLASSYHYTLIGSGLEMVSFLVGLAYKMDWNKKEATKSAFELHKKEKEKEHLLKLQELQEKKHEAELQLKNNELISLSMRVASKNEVLDKVYQHVKGSSQVKDRNLVEEIRTKLRLEDDWATFKIRFERINPYFFKKLSEDSAQLTENDMRIASLIYINLDTHQICQLLNISQRTVQTSKYRLKKKLGLAKETDLKSYLLSIGQEESV